MIGVILLTILVIVFTHKWYAKTKIPFKFPPGPYGLPILGYAPFLKRRFFDVIEELHVKFGDIYSVNLGPNPRVIVIGDYKTLIEVFRHDELTYRPPSQHNFRHEQEGNGDPAGLMFSVGNEWQEQRRFSLKGLKDLGFGKSTMESLIHLEVNALNESLSKTIGQPIDLKNKFNISVINALWTLISGTRYELDHPDLLDIVKKVDRLTNSSQSSLANLFPWLSKIAPNFTGATAISRIMYDVLGFVQKTIQDHTKQFDVSDEPNDFIESYLQKISRSPNDSSFHNLRGKHNLESSILDLLFAGSETTSTALTWALLLLIRHPDIQMKVQSELDKVIGRDRLPNLADRFNLPYTEAFIYELLRYCCIAPLGLPHMAGGDVETTDGKYKIPKGTVVFPNLYHVVNDPNVFPNPRNFNPTRFLDNDGQFVRSERMVVFGVGKRDCLGKTLANAQLYLFITGLMQRYNFRTIEKRLEDINTEPVIGFTTVAPHFKLIITER